jgi:hypothetical protein
VGELGLSPAALDVDDAVRGDVADANVRETVKRRVRERLDEGVSGFEPAAGGAETITERTDDVEPSEASTSEAETAETVDATDATEPGVDVATEPDDETGETDDEPGEIEDEPATEPTPDETEAERRTGDGQVSMEDYL